MSGNLVTLADAGARTVFEFGRIQSPLDWLWPLAIFVVLAWFVIVMYVLDCVELGIRRAVLLGGLRVLALVGLLAIYLQPQWREQREIVSNSQVAVLVDTSQSMQRVDVGEATTASAGGSRSAAIVSEFTGGEFLADLRTAHDVAVYRFDQDDRPTALATLPKLPDVVANSSAAGAEQASLAASIATARGQLIFAIAALGLGFAGIVTYLGRKTNEDRFAAVLLVVSTVCLLASVSVAFWAFAAHEGVGLREVLALPEPSDAEVAAGDEQAKEASINWLESLEARGTETRLGTAVARLIEEKATGTLSAIVVLSDGQSNAGLDVAEGAALAAEADVPIHCLGFGSTQKPQFVAIGDYAAPSRAMPEDPFEITAYVQSRGFDGRDATVILQQVGADEGEEVGEDLGIFEEQEITLGDAEENLAVKFTVDGIPTPGRYALELGVVPPGKGEIDELTRQRFVVEVVLRKTKVLLIAGGPTRDYRFLRNMLYRDKSSEVDVFLQSARDAVSQDANRVLAQFPTEVEELFDYDCIVAFDPDWTTFTAPEIENLVRWVSDEAGGMIVIPSLVHAGNPVSSWIHEGHTSDLQQLYPVVFHERFAQLNFQRGATEKAAPIELTREGLAAEFLRLDKDATAGPNIWEIFPGIYGAYPVVGAKPGATVYARYDDPMPQSAGDDPVYMASHFYGAGRVFYLGSGEMWRLRRYGDGVFEKFYINLVRHVSQGRLLRGSRRGDILLLEQTRYFVGDTVPVVAHLKDNQRQPLKLQSANLLIMRPNGESTQLVLSPDPNREGTYRGQFPARDPGDYQLVLPLPESIEDPLMKKITVETSGTEDQRPDRNDEVLSSLAQATGGQYYLGFAAAAGRSGDRPLSERIADRTQITPQFGDVDPAWSSLWAKSMMFLVCGLLCLEWLLRRILKLA
ncbi:MAG: VWA domain-containing protein [Planctomycetota bacterium]|nr:MAG: VWA domain-containing protein [Planctomycetota bacterium]